MRDKKKRGGFVDRQRKGVGVRTKKIDGKKKNEKEKMKVRLIKTRQEGGLEMKDFALFNNSLSLARMTLKF